MPAAPVASAEPCDLMVDQPMWSRIYLAAEQLSHVQRPSRSPLRCGQEDYLAAEPLNHVQRRAAHPCIFSDRAAQDIWTREHFLFERAHMKREMFQSDTMSRRLKSRQKAEKSRPKGRSSVRAPMGSSPFHYGRLFQSVKRALFKDRGDLFVHFLYVYLASASTNAIAVQAPN